MATASLIKEDPHIADTVNKTESYRVLRGRVNGLGYSPDARLMPYLELVGFGSAALIWTFDLLLQIDWSPVAGVSAIAKPSALCYSLLGASPGDDESNLSGLKFTWLKANFQHLADNATEEELMCAARAYIMHIIGGVLMPDVNNNRVHLMYLPLLTDLHNVRSISWGSAVLAMLYRELCWATKPHAEDIGGCLILLQSWALYRMPFLASFIWMPYRRPEIVAVIPSSAYIYSQLWCTNAPIISFNVVKWYHGDRVLRQFGCIQYIPDPPKEVGKVHDINKRGKHGMHWGVVHRRYIAVWDNRMGRRPRMDMSSDLQPSPEYMQWAYEPVADIEPDPQPDLEPKREVELEAQPQAESKQLHSHSADISYHPDFPDNDYFLGSSGGGYHYGLDIFGWSPSQHSTSLGLYPPQYSTSLGPYPPQYSTPPGMYPLQHGTPPGSSSSMSFELYDFSSVYQTPSLGTEEDVGRRDHPQRERRPPNRYTRRTTPSNHQL
ncbi:hypothetical protein PVK06_024241 [Gossypium arboreum]|uniref:Aminotransferase-like plant mobile domain-containing protein n=1 Tax=Gossypium arboreum TaxID=29729 RepID=A0ABR0PDD4_GOSAR|nr:hypothetical protein PVK06_024241 [Gossypium arboreum]